MIFAAMSGLKVRKYVCCYTHENETPLARLPQ